MEQHKQLTGNTLPVYGVHGNIADYETSQKEQLSGGAKGLPPDDYLLTGEDAINPQDAWTDFSSTGKSAGGGIFGFGKKTKTASPRFSKTISSQELEESKALKKNPDSNDVSDFFKKEPKPSPKKKDGGGGFFGKLLGPSNKDKPSKPTSAKSKKSSYVPPPPPNGAKIPTPPNNKIKTFPISSGQCPAGMELPGIQTS